MEFPKEERNQLKRIPGRGQYDQETVYAILDAGFLCHVGFVVEGQPFVIPTAYGRDEDVIYLHGATTSRMLTQLASGIPACLTVTHLDGLVLARSAFHHSMNYRSAVVFGTAQIVPEADKERALFVISENILKDRWAEARSPNANELKATTVVALKIESASAKIRTGPPKDEEEDYSLPVWAGVIPMSQQVNEPIVDPLLSVDVELPPSVSALVKPHSQ